MALGCVKAIKGLSVAAAIMVTAASAWAAPPAVQSDRTRVKDNEVTLDFRGAHASTDKIQVLTREGMKLEPLAGALKKEPGEAPKVSIPAEVSVMIRKQSAVDKKPQPLSSTETALDSVLIESVPVLGNEKLRDIRQWTLIIYASQTPLVWNANRRAYTTELLIGLKELGPSAGSRPSNPVTVQLIGKGVSVDPPTLQLKEAGVSGIQRTVVSLANHRTRGTVGAISDFGEQFYAVEPRAQLAMLNLRSSLTVIPGFGIGTTELSAVRRAEDGLELADRRPLTIPLTTSGGRLETSRLLIEANSSSSTSIEFRSSWLGHETVNAAVDGVTASPLNLTFTTPWSYLIAILLGAALGAYVRVRPRTKTQQYQFLAGVGVGVILGLGSFIGISSITRVPPTAVVTELGCFVVAAVEAYLGRTALDRITGAKGTKA